ncbi:MAG: hypothetical protein J6A21_11615 [Lentisphaeria bacterium]|nr:hypothetical protein [Lentisphaeria bacterium]
MHTVLEKLRHAGNGEKLFFSLTEFCEEEKALLSGEEIVSVCREKSLQLFLEIAESAAKEILPEAWRLFSTEQIAALPAGTILDGQKLPFLRVALPWKALLYGGRVAGYDTLPFGVPEEKIPLLFVHPAYRKLFFCAFPLSSFVRRRYAPYCRWKILREHFCSSPAPEPEITVFAGKNTMLSPDSEERGRKKVYSLLRNSFLYREEGVLKAAEGFSGEILADGSQTFRKRERSDCVMETAAAFAADFLTGGNPEHGKISDELFARICDDPAHMEKKPSHPCFGLMKFYENTPVFYPSGNALSALLLAAMKGNDPVYIEKSLRIMFTLLRLTGKEGFIRHKFQLPDSFREHDETFYASEGFFHPCPHRQAAVWTLFLAAWKLTGYPEFLQTAKRGIGRIMEVYPRLKWMNDFSAEGVKMLRPLAFLYRLEKTKEHGDFLERIVSDVEKLLDPSGAVRASLGNLEDGLFPPPGSNEEYGTREASLIQTGKDPCCDLLYTQSFAFAGMHEAFLATGKEKYGALADRMAGFLLRTQIVSREHEELSGGWMRAFDPEKWEYYGSSADASWGAWCMESGWLNAPCAMIFTLRKAGKGLFDLLGPDRAWKGFVPEILRETERERALPQETGTFEAVPGNDL